jgi:hypothetical protein
MKRMRTKLMWLGAALLAVAAQPELAPSVPVSSPEGVEQTLSVLCNQIDELTATGAPVPPALRVKVSALKGEIVALQDAIGRGGRTAREQ